MTAAEILEGTVRAACDAALREGTSTARIKADTAQNVLHRIALGDIPLTPVEAWKVSERMNRASGTADRSVAVSMLEVIIGIGIRRTA